MDMTEKAMSSARPAVQKAAVNDTGSFFKTVRFILKIGLQKPPVM